MARHRNDLPRICKGCMKRRWPTEGDAIAEAVRRMADGSPPLGVYRCPRGNQWHLTSKEVYRRPSQAASNTRKTNHVTKGAQ